jgi:hypothetical protein
MRVSILVLTGLFWAAATLAASAGTFDGKWVADIPAEGRCNYTSTLEILIADGNITGQVHNPANVVPVSGKVDNDGNGSLLVANVSQATLKITGDRFDANWQNSQCSRHAEGGRVDAGRDASLATERKQYQDKFADLVTRAESGDKQVDYTALRTAYVYTENWDFYDTKTVSLMQQAYAAKKGEDCVTALADLDQVIKFDFTIAEAHSMRADCLEDSDRAHARIESAIADGLTDSVTGSGDGESEKTAYVVDTVNEENEILLHKHFQLRARQTEVRGADGRHYDTVQAIALNNGVVRERNIYFDVSSFAKGRESKRAAAALTAASIH